jgi:high affinity Mn2+ porin
MNKPTPQAAPGASAGRRGASATLRWAAVIYLAASSIATQAQDTPGAVTTNVMANVEEQKWNWHIQNTDIVQGDSGFPAKYSGPSSLNSKGEIQETVSLDLFVGVRLWPGAEAHMDGLMWQGFGLSKTLGVEGFPNGEAFRLGTKVPNLNIPRLFIRQTIGLGGEQETVEDDQLHLAGKQDVSRITLTLGKMSAKDIFDNNAYANDPRTQFMNWGLMANEAWDYPADALGYMTGFAAELNQPHWTARYGFFQMPSTSNGVGQDEHYLKAWGMVTEFERRYTVNGHPGAVRLLGYLNSAHMGSYQAAVDNAARTGLPADIEATRAYRYKYGFGLNMEQEIFKNVGAFARLGWSDGQNEAWVFADVDQTASLGLSIKGEFWGRANDTVGLAGIINGISRVHQEFLAAGGAGILAEDGNLDYGLERILETYYDFQIWKTLHGALDYQFITDPAYNRDRGPVSVFGARLHWEL